MANPYLRYSFTLGLTVGLCLIIFNAVLPYFDLRTVNPLIQAGLCGLAFGMTVLFKNFIVSIPKALRYAWDETFFLAPVYRKITQRIAAFQVLTFSEKCLYGARLAMPAHIVSSSLIIMSLLVFVVDFPMTASTKNWVLLGLFLLVVYVFVTTISLMVGFSEITGSDVTRIGLAIVGLASAIPFVGIVFATLFWLVALIFNIPAFVRWTVRGVVDLVTFAPNFLFHLIQAIHRRLFALCMIDGFCGYLISYQLFVVNLALPPLGYCLGGFVVGVLVGFVHYELISVRLLKLNRASI